MWEGWLNPASAQVCGEQGILAGLGERAHHLIGSLPELHSMMPALGLAKTTRVAKVISTLLYLSRNSTVELVAGLGNRGERKLGRMQKVVRVEVCAGSDPGLCVNMEALTLPLIGDKPGH
jgi:hypothetical protein